MGQIAAKGLITHCSSKNICPTVFDLRVNITDYFYKIIISIYSKLDCYLYFSIIVFTSLYHLIYRELMDETTIKTQATKTQVRLIAGAYTLCVLIFYYAPDHCLSGPCYSHKITFFVFHIYPPCICARYTSSCRISDRTNPIGITSYNVAMHIEAYIL